MGNRSTTPHHSSTHSPTLSSPSHNSPTHHSTINPLLTHSLTKPPLTQHCEFLWALYECCGSVVSLCVLFAQISDNISSWRVTIFKQLATIVWRCRVVAKFVTSTVYFYLYQLEGLSEMSPILLLLFWIPVPPTQGVEHLQEPLCSLKNTCPLLSYTI